MRPQEERVCTHSQVVVQMVQDDWRRELVLEHPFHCVGHGVEDERARTKANVKNLLAVVFVVPFNAEERSAL